MHFVSKLLILLITLISASALSETVVVTSNDSPIGNLTQKEVREIFLGKRSHYDDIRIRPVDNQYDKSIRNKFYQDTIGKTPTQMRAYWAIQVFSGKGKQPVKVSSFKELVNWLSENPGGIGYCDSKEVTNKLKVVYRQ